MRNITCKCIHQPRSRVDRHTRAYSNIHRNIDANTDTNTTELIS